MIDVKSIELMSRDIEDIKIFMNELIDYYNILNNTNVPMINFEVSINKRLTKTLGRFAFLMSTSVKPKHIQFSNIIMFESDELLENVIKHELAHYIATMIYQKNCEHDREWEEVCECLGMETISPYTRINNYNYTYRYLIICENDGIVATRNRLTHNFKKQIELNFTICSICKKDKLVIYDTKEKCFIVGKENEKIMKFILDNKGGELI